MQHILIECAFDSEFSLCSIDDNSIKLIENHINDNRNILDNINCDHREMYRAQTTVKLLPGHRTTLLNMKDIFKENKMKEDHAQDPALSCIMNTMITTARKNWKPLNTRRYPKLITDFAIYTYLCSGKSSYKMLSKNLPLPQTTTICKLT